MIIKNIIKNKFKWVDSRVCWNEKKRNLNQQNYLVNKIKLINDVFVFWNMDEILICILPGQATNIYAFETPNSSRAYFVTTHEGVCELIQKNLNFLHEVLIDIPVKPFFDFDCVVDVEYPKDFKHVVEEKKMEIEQIKKRVVEILQIDQYDWLLLESHKEPTKISFHLTGNLFIKNRLVMFENVDHWTNFVNEHFHGYQFIDNGFPVNKPLRMYHCCNRSNRKRILGEGPFDSNVLKRSYLCLRPEIKEFVQISFFRAHNNGHNNGLERKKKARKNVNKIMMMSTTTQQGKKDSLKVIHHVNDEAIVFFKQFLRFLKIRKLFINTNSFELGRVKYDDKYFSTILIELKGNKCLLKPNMGHTHKYGRSLFVKPKGDYVIIWCASTKHGKKDRERVYLRKCPEKLQKAYDALKKACFP